MNNEEHENQTAKTRSLMQAMFPVLLYVPIILGFLYVSKELFQSGHLCPAWAALACAFFTVPSIKI